jgi:hypothetical protein
MRFWIFLCICRSSNFLIKFGGLEGTDPRGVRARDADAIRFHLKIKKLKYQKTEEQKAKLRTYQLGVKQSEETIKKRINNGFHKTEEYRKKMSESLSGDKNPNKKEENKKKLRKPKRPRTKEHSQKISESKKGKPTWNKGIELEKFVCEICGKEIGGKGNLSQHTNKHLLNG